MPFLSKFSIDKLMSLLVMSKLKWTHNKTFFLFSFLFKFQSAIASPIQRRRFGGLGPSRYAEFWGRTHGVPPGRSQGPFIHERAVPPIMAPLTLCKRRRRLVWRAPIFQGREKESDQDGDREETTADRGERVPARRAHPAGQTSRERRNHRPASSVGHQPGRPVRKQSWDVQPERWRRGRVRNCRNERPQVCRRNSSRRTSSQRPQCLLTQDQSLSVFYGFQIRAHQQLRRSLLHVRRPQPHVVDRGDGRPRPLPFRLVHGFNLRSGHRLFAHQFRAGPHWLATRLRHGRVHERRRQVSKIRVVQVDCVTHCVAREASTFVLSVNLIK